jgi:hypothetical protein
MDASSSTHSPCDGVLSFHKVICRPPAAQQHIFKSMKTKQTNAASTPTPARRVSILVAAASLLLAPCLFAQTAAPVVKAPPPQPSPEGQPMSAPEEKLYSLKYAGSGDTWDLNYALREQVSAENVVMTQSARGVRVPDFEVRNVTLAEIAHTIEFLSEGKLRVEVMQNAGRGSVWLIGRKDHAAVKMRSVAAPNLFANEKALADILKEAETFLLSQREMAGISNLGDGWAEIRPLQSQKIIAIVGGEDAVAGLENLIQVAELEHAKAVADLHREAPKMKAVAAPHLFASEERVGRFLQECEVMRVMREKLTAHRWERAGFRGGAPRSVMDDVVEIEPRRHAGLFVLVGHPDAIAGIESLIQAAEAEARAEAELKTGEKPAKEGKSEQ